MSIRKFIYGGALVTGSFLFGKSIFAFSIEPRPDTIKYYGIKTPEVGNLGSVSCIYQKVYEKHPISTRGKNGEIVYSAINEARLYKCSNAALAVVEVLFKYNKLGSKYTLDQEYMNRFFPNDSVVYLD